MRKRRAIVFDDEPVVLLVPKDFLETRGYEVLAFSEPVICPVYGDTAGCTNKAPCGDIILADYGMPTMTGVELFQAYARNGCKLTLKNKALLTGYMDVRKMQDIRELGNSVL
jgi:CheY-like chemotaxis protein